MTMQAPSQYAAPSGFFSNFTVDKTGQLFSEGKALNGVMMDAKSAAMGGNILGLSTDSKGNVFADMSVRKPPVSPTGISNGQFNPPSSPIYNGQFNPQGSPWESPFQTIRIPLSGVQLDPDRYSKSGEGELGDNQLFLRPDESGAYFAQVNTGNQVVAYAYSAIQQAKNPDQGGPQSPTNNNQRRQGGNAGGGASPTSSMVSLLGD